MSTARYVTPFEEHLDLARQDIAKGDIDSALGWLYTAKHRAVNTGHEVPTEAIATILENARTSGLGVEAAYRRLVEKELKTAEYGASMGHRDHLIAHLEQAREYAAPVGAEIPADRVRDMFGVAFRKRIGERVRSAGKGVELSEQAIARIEEIAYEEGVRAAREYMDSLK